LFYAQTIESISAFMKEQGVSQRELARRLGTTEPWVSRLLNGRQNTTVKTLAEVAWALGVRLAVVAEPAPGSDVVIPAWWRRIARQAARP
jgi:transcriptional regulator with XRE-family HTH domain